MTEKWIRWEPISGLSNKYYIDSISEDLQGFKISLSEVEDKNRVQVFFKNAVYAYRRIDEGLRLKTIDNLKEKYCGAFYGYWTFFKVIDSEYLKWISEESYEIVNQLLPSHFSFVAADLILDVIALSEPKVEFVE